MEDLLNTYEVKVGFIFITIICLLAASFLLVVRLIYKKKPNGDTPDNDDVYSTFSSFNDEDIDEDDTAEKSVGELEKQNSVNDQTEEISEKGEDRIIGDDEVVVTGSNDDVGFLEDNNIESIDEYTKGIDDLLKDYDIDEFKEDEEEENDDEDLELKNIAIEDDEEEESFEDVQNDLKEYFDDEEEDNDDENNKNKD